MADCRVKVDPLRKLAVMMLSAAVALAVGEGARAAPVAAQTAADAIVTVGITNSTTDAALLIAEKLGYFKEQGIDAKLLPFDAAAKMMAPAGSGQLDVAAGAPSAALYNALAAHVNVKIVADKGSAAPGYGFQPVLVRKALVTSGEYKSPKDLKGMRFAEGAPGTAAAVFVTKFLKQGGLGYSDVKHVYLGFPLMIAAFSNGAIDAAALPEPNATIAERAGYAIRVMGNDQIYPNQQLTVLMYGGSFISSRHDVAQKFMLAYLKAVRYYNDALVGGHLRGRTANGVIDVLTDVMGTKDTSVFRSMTASANDPNGRVNVASLKEDLAFLRDQGLVTDPNVDVDDAVDVSFAEAAVKTMGPYRARK
jgi:NitT/TauT family transport system substrate-binding protein